MIVFRIDKASGVATYVQLIHQVKQALRLGIVGVGDRLPTAREVVASTAINPNTVHKAYRELEREGLVEARPGLGTFILRSMAHPEATVDSPLGRELGSWMRAARSAALSRDDIEALVKAVLDDTFS